MRHARVRQAVVALMAEYRLDAIAYPLQKRLVVPIIDPNQADRNGILAAITGFPAITVPAGFSAPTSDAPIGVPIGIDFLGRPWSDGRADRDRPPLRASDESPQATAQHAAVGGEIAAKLLDPGSSH